MLCRKDLKRTRELVIAGLMMVKVSILKGHKEVQGYLVVLGRGTAVMS